MDCAAVNSWLQYRDDCLDYGVQKSYILDLIALKMRIAECLIGGVGPDENDDVDDEDPPPRVKTPGRPGTVPLPFREVARQNAARLPKATDLPYAQK